MYLILLYFAFVFGLHWEDHNEEDGLPRCPDLGDLGDLEDTAWLETEMRIMNHAPFVFVFFSLFPSFSISFLLTSWHPFDDPTYPEVWPSGTTYVEFDSAKDLSNKDTMRTPWGYRSVRSWTRCSCRTESLRLRCLRKTSLARSSLSRSIFSNVPRERDK